MVKPDEEKPKDSDVDDEDSIDVEIRRQFNTLTRKVGFYTKGAGQVVQKYGLTPGSSAKTKIQIENNRDTISIASFYALADIVVHLEKIEINLMQTTTTICERLNSIEEILKKLKLN